MIWSVVFILCVFAVYACLSIILFRRRKAMRRLQPPESVTVLRGPGESLRKKMETCLDQLMETTLDGACVSVVLAVAPLLILKWRPEADPWLLIGSGLALFLAAAIWVMRRSLRLLNERSNARLGWLGECFVAEHLHACAAAGYHVYHDVPMTMGGRTTNIDHVAVGPHAAVVIETKMRSKPADQPGGKIEVEYDGKRLSWPRYPHDTKTLWQVNANAEWLGNYLREQCGFAVPVRQVIAIPGWSVKEKVLGQPRVVSGKGVADAVLQAVDSDQPRLFSHAQVKQMRQALDRLCRDVE